MAATVFISYARSDLERVRQIAHGLKDAGFAVFLDVESIQGGDRWMDVLEKAIRGADFLLTVISRASAESNWVQREAEVALTQQMEASGQKIIPVRLDAVPTATMSPFLRKIQWVDFTGSFDDGMMHLLHALGVAPGERADDLEISGPALRDILDENYLKALVQEKVRDLAGGVITGMAGQAVLVELEKLSGTVPGDAIAIDPALVFVISSHAPDMEYVFEAISAACKRSGLQAQRVTDVVGDYRITNKIEHMIRTARFIVCDLTHERPNVYFELGFARGIGKTVITIARKDAEIHFDVKDWTYIPYEDSRPLEKDLERHVKQLVQQVQVR